MPKLWTTTIEAHRRGVHEAILATTAALVAEHGLRAVTMSQIAEQTGIGRATLYKYFPDVDTILLAWHEQQISAHLEHLAQIRDRVDDPGKRLEAVLEAYAHIQHQRMRHVHDRHGGELAAMLHQDEHLAPTQHRLRAMFRGLLTDAARSGDVRDDMASDELAGYCLHALDGAGSLPSKAAVRRLVALILAGLRPPG